MAAFMKFFITFLVAHFAIYPTVKGTWYVEPSPIVEGGKLKIRFYSNQNCLAVTWTRDPNLTTLIINGTSANSDKFYGTKQDDWYQLDINNVEKTDVNTSYTLHCGFHQHKKYIFVTSRNFTERLEERHNANKDDTSKEPKGNGGIHPDISMVLMTIVAIIQWFNLYVDRM